jgi:prephenate dehydrogenase
MLFGMMVNRVGIVGLGLIGASIAKALRQARSDVHLVGVDAESCTARLSHNQSLFNHLEHTITPTSALAQCDLVFVATPLESIPDVFKLLSGSLGEQGVVTDVCGVKEVVMQWAETLLPQHHFVGGHPMVGGPTGGFKHSQEHLFSGHEVALCPQPASPPAIVDTLSELWQVMGAKVQVMPAVEHDQWVAITSHLPYVTAVAQTLLAGQHASTPPLQGPSFQDATKRAAFSPDIMASVLENNRHAPSHIRALANILIELSQHLNNAPQDFREMSKKARELQTQFKHD